MDNNHSSNDDFNLLSLGIFTALTFLLTWGLSALIIFKGEWVTSIFGELSASNPLFMLAVYSPGLVAIGLVWKRHDLLGVISFFRRFIQFRASRNWWAFMLIGIPAVFYTGAAIKGTISDPFPFSPWVAVFPALLLALFLGPIEEFGWRGFALPVLQKYLVPFWAGLVIGIVWAIWHIPAFLMSGAPQSGWSYWAFFAGVVSISVILTPLFNRAKGSLFIAYFFHFQMMNPIWPDAQPYDTWLFVLVTVLVVWFCRNEMFSKKAASTLVLS